MAHLDCENPDSALRSLSLIYATDEARLRSFFDSIDLEQHYRNSCPELASDAELQRLLESEIGPPRGRFQRAYWFHLTRVPRGTTFSEGILPLNQALPRIWSTLIAIFAGTRHESRLRLMQIDGVHDFQYNLKASDSIHWGPNAMLVREIAFSAAAASNHDYLKIPEIIEDLCNGYAKHYGESIQEEVERALVPTVVKFWSKYEYGLSSAIRYVYAAHHKEELRQSANTCFDGAGQTVPHERIVYVKHLN